MAWYWIVLIVLGALFVLLQLVYWLNLDNKLIFYVVRPMLNKAYDKKPRSKSCRTVKVCKRWIDPPV